MKKFQMFLLLCILPILLKAQDIDTQNSYVSFGVRNMMIRTVTGTIKGMQGKINFDEKSVHSSSFEVCVDVSTINTDNKKRDKHLKHEDYFHVEQYPTICFKSDEITKQKDGFLAEGKLTMHGITKAVKIPFTYKDGRFKGAIKVKRYDYGIGGKDGFMIGKEVDITILAFMR